MKKFGKLIVRGIEILWEDILAQFKMVCYIVTIIFFLFGIVAAFTGAPGLGIFLIILNVVLFLLIRKLDKASQKKEEEEFDEMVRRNRGE